MILQKSAQNVNSNAGVFLAKQLLDRMGGFSRFDGWQKSERPVPCQRYSNSSLVKAQVALMSLGKTSFADIAAHQQDDLFADAIRGVVSHVKTKGTQDRPLFCVYEVVETKADDMLLPDVEVSLWWTNLPDDADTVVRLYHEHATHEQFHSELKTDLDAERLPSGSFAVNELVLALATLSFNILRIIGGIALEVRGVAGGVSRLRLRTVLLNYIYVGAICGSHGGRRHLRLGRNCHVADAFMKIAARLAS